MDAKFGPYPLCETQAVRSGDRRTFTPPLYVTTSFTTVELAVQPGPSAKAGADAAAIATAATPCISLAKPSGLESIIGVSPERPDCEWVRFMDLRSFSLRCGIQAEASLQA